MGIHQFTKDVAGAIYVAVGGSDSSPGTNKEDPRATIKNLGNQVIGPGVYRGNTSAPNAVVQRIEADTPGTVQWITQQANGSRFGGYEGIHFIGDPFFLLGNLEVSYCTDCIIENCNDLRGTPTVTRCVILNSDVLTAGSIYFRLESTIVISSDISVGFISNSYCNRFSKLEYKLTVPGNLKYSNIEGVIILDGIEYAIQDQLVGTPQDNGYDVGVEWLNEANLTANGYTGTIAGWDAQVATCMNRDPRFTDATKGVYKLQADSPMIAAAENGIDNIGGKPFGFFVTPDGANNNTIFVIPSANMDVTNPAQPFLPFNESQGTIRYVIKVADSPVNFDSPIDIEGVLAFDTSFAGGTAQNNTVPSYEPQAPVLELITSASAPDNTTLICNNGGAGHGLNIGDAVRYSGQSRTIIDVPDFETIIVDAPFRANVAQLESFIGGTVRAITALNPNKLELQWRTTQSPSLPVNDAGWDNDLDPVLNYAGEYFIQEFFKVPQKIINGNDVYGNADPERPLGVGTVETFQLTWIDVIVTFRNDYRKQLWQVSILEYRISRPLVSPEQRP